MSGPRGLPLPQASDVLRDLLRPASQRGAALRASLPGGVVPTLPQLFRVGQFVRCVVSELDEGAPAEGLPQAEAGARPQPAARKSGARAGAGSLRA